MPIDFVDKLRSTRADGLLVDLKSIDTAATALTSAEQADFRDALASGLPVYHAIWTWDAADDRLTLSIADLGTNDLPTGRAIQLVGSLPAAMPRSGADIVVAGHGLADVPLYDIAGTAQKSRDLTPGGLHTVFVSNRHHAVFFTETLTPRPQDFDIFHGWSIPAPGLVTTGVSESSDTVTVQAYPLAPAPQRATYIFAVPLDARQIDRIQTEDGTVLPIEDAGFTGDIAGVTHRFYRSSSLLNISFLTGLALRVIFGDYA